MKAKFLSLALVSALLCANMSDAMEGSWRPRLWVDAPNFRTSLENHLSQISEGPKPQKKRFRELGDEDWEALTRADALKKSREWVCKIIKAARDLGDFPRDTDEVDLDDLKGCGERFSEEDIDSSVGSSGDEEDEMDFEAAYVLGMRTFQGCESWEEFVNDITGVKYRLRVYLEDARVYETYATDQGHHLTLQEVPGDGECADHSMGIARQAFRNKLKEALETELCARTAISHAGEVIDENDYPVTKFVNSFEAGKVFSDLENKQWLDFTPPAEAAIQVEGNISSLMHLAAYLFQLNLEIYVPDFTEELAIADDYQLINRLRLKFKVTHQPESPVIRLLHSGNIEGIKKNGGGHFRLLYDSQNMTSMERLKVELLEQASELYFSGEGNYEDILKDMSKLKPIEPAFQFAVPYPVSSRTKFNCKRISEIKSLIQECGMQMSPLREMGYTMAEISEAVRMI